MDEMMGKDGMIGKRWVEDGWNDWEEADRGGWDDREGVVFKVEGMMRDGARDGWDEVGCGWEIDSEYRNGWDGVR